uniref:Uncharacterized protein n=1 Tax=Tanacetum cinerariifolium TaxID=118510 RepID=A0A699JKQ8_TANCI|nr:hypothetical protein [Tanacetum cinerariifolium]
MAKLAFCDYHNMIAILEKTKHNIDFLEIVDFLEASHLRYALTICPTIYVSHIRQFWSTARIKTTNQETKILATVDAPTEPHTHRQYTRRAIRIAQSKALSPAADDLVSLSRDDKQGEAFPTVSSLDAGQDMENINKTSTLPYESSPRFTSRDADEGSIQQRLQELMELCTSLQRQQSQMAAKIEDQDLEISGGIIEIGEEVRADKSTELESNDTEEMVNVLSSIEAANILTSRVATASVSLVAGVSTAGVPTINGSFPIVSAILTTASVRVNEQLARDSKIVRLHAEEELKMMIEGLDRSNGVIAKHLQEYEQAAADLSVGEKIELINELVKYQDHHTKILKYSAQPSKPLLKKEQREFYMSFLKSHAGWKTRHFKGIKLEEIKEKFIPVWK